MQQVAREQPGTVCAPAARSVVPATGQGPGGSCDDGCGEVAGLARLAALAVQEAAWFAARAEQLHDSAVLSRRVCGADGPERFLVVELAGTLRIGQLAAGSLLAAAQRLVEVLTGTLGGLRDGRVFVGQAQVVLAQTGSCTEQVAAEVDRRLHAGAPDGLAGWSGRRLHDRVRRLVLTVEAELDPAATLERERTARQSRRVAVRPEPDAMGSLWALLPAEQLRTFTLGLDELHRRQLVTDRQQGIERTADQRRADLLVLLPALALHALDASTPTLAGDGTCTHPAVVLNVHVPLATALGLSQAPGTLDGYGPISAAHARSLLPTATLRRIIVDDTTGQPLHTRTTPTLRPTPVAGAGRAGVGGSAGADDAAGGTADAPPEAAELVRSRLRRLLTDQPLTLADLTDPDEPQYQPSTTLAAFVRLRDPLCTGVGCATHSRRSDLDHHLPWPQGPTAARNLRPLSRRCHRAKTLSWTVTHHPDGSHTWTSPTGRSYPVPPSWDPPPTPRPPAPTPAPAPGPLEEPDTWTWLTLHDGHVQPTRHNDDDGGLTHDLDQAPLTPTGSTSTPSTSTPRPATSREALTPDPDASPPC